MKPSTVPFALLCALCVSVAEPAAAGGVQASRSVIVLPARLHGPRSESVVLRTGGAVIERVTPPAPDFKLTLREDAPGAVYLLTLTVPAGDYRDLPAECAMTGTQGVQQPQNTEASDVAPSPAPLAITVHTAGQDAPLTIPIRFQHSTQRTPDEWNQPARALVGHPAPAVSATTLDGQPVAFGNLFTQGQLRRRAEMPGATVSVPVPQQNSTGKMPVPHPTGKTPVPQQNSAGGTPAPQTTGEAPVPHRAVKAIIFWGDLNGTGSIDYEMENVRCKEVLAMLGGATPGVQGNSEAKPAGGKGVIPAVSSRDHLPGLRARPAPFLVCVLATGMFFGLFRLSRSSILRCAPSERPHTPVNGYM